MNARVMQHIGTRAPGSHNVHQMGPRMPPSNLLQLGPVGQGMPNNPQYVYSTQQGVQVGMCYASILT